MPRLHTRAVGALFVGAHWMLTGCATGPTGGARTGPLDGGPTADASFDASFVAVDGGRDARGGDTGVVTSDASREASAQQDAVAESAAGDSAVEASGLDSAADTLPPAGDGGCTLSGSPEVVSAGTAGSYLLRGTIVGPTGPFTGEVLVVGTTIACAATSCAGTAGASAATIIDTHGIVFPGLIDTHNHILFDIFDETDWTPSKVYTNHNQWTAEPGYSAMVNAKQYLNGESGSPWDYGCEMDKYGELKGLVAGTTSIVGAANPADRSCFGSLARTIDQSPNGLSADHVQVATLFPNATSADGVCTNFGDGDTDAYLIHIAEGTDSTAHAEFAKLQNLTSPASCLFARQTTIVHGTALVDADFATMATAGMSLTWSPRSNIFLYGGGTDLTKTTNIPLALSHGLNISIAPDWSMGGSQNLLDELRFAQKVDQAVFGGTLTSQNLVDMVTKNPAKALGLSTTLGSLAAGFRADVLVISGDTTAPYDALLAATPREVRLVFVNGVPLYGDAALASIAPVPAGASACDTLDTCCGAKFVCMSRASVTTGDKLDESYPTVQAALSGALTAYDGMALSPYVFAPLTPLVRCDTAP